MKLFNELPTVLPFYTNIKNQDRFKENTRNNIPIAVFSPNNAFLPFMLRVPLNSPPPESWKIFNTNDEEVIDISNNIALLKAFNFEDFALAYYHGETIIFQHETIQQEMNLTGRFYMVIQIDGESHFSEVFTMCKDLKNEGLNEKFVKVMFWDDKDIEPLRYRNGFKQWVFLDTFIHESDPKIDQDNETDGYGNDIPVFQKLVVRQKIEVIVPDFLKVALLAMQLHDNIFVEEHGKRSGMVDRASVIPATEDFGSYSTIDLSFETELLTKTTCEKNSPIISEIWQ